MDIAKQYVAVGTLTETISLIAVCRGVSFIYGHLHFAGDSFTTQPVMCGLGLAFTSRDGEYRATIKPYTDVLHIIESNIQALEQLELTAMTAITNKELTITAKVNSVAERTLLSIFVLVWDDLLFSHHTGTIENNLHPAAELLISLATSIGSSFVMPSRLPLSVLRQNDHGNGNRSKYGQKLIPLTIAGVASNAYYSGWSELFAANRCAELTLNKRSPAFGGGSPWYAVVATNADVYSNVAMIEKYELSERAHLTSLHIASAREPLRDPKSLRKSGVVLLRLNQGDIALHETILLSKYSLLMCPTYNGRTFIDFVSQLTLNNAARLDGKKRSDDNHMTANLGVGASFDDIMEPLMFEYLWALYILHNHGHTHGDLHANNYTVITASACQQTRGFVRAKQKYSVPYYGHTAGIIDFSRSITKNYIDYRHTLSQRAAMVDVLHIGAASYSLPLPKYTAEYCCVGDNDLFSVCCLSDCIDLFKSMTQVLTDADAIRSANLAAAVRDAAIDMYKKAHVELLLTMYESDDNQSPSPALDLIERFFGKYSQTRRTNDVEIFRADAALDITYTTLRGEYTPRMPAVSAYVINPMKFRSDILNLP